MTGSPGLNMLMNPSRYAFSLVSLLPRISFYINKFSLPEQHSLQATYACVGATRTGCKPKEKGVTNGLPCSAALPFFSLPCTPTGRIPPTQHSVEKKRHLRLQEFGRKCTTLTERGGKGYISLMRLSCRCCCCFVIIPRA